ncbi:MULTISPECIES: DeoR/GlpR family DNA-binding transcription regulator [Paenibacillus]|uniref:Transcriptional regulator, DeoR family n=2 Tax=Paenibacillus lactis TaxID=228574 RepID=G4HDQ4_9BACL|nr:DeoR/GlpR family DNA-binding transcription regulator [Paenibacillus lactis]EHB64973.1 transcriptional regulator, DeoR family [Paenibacillus lactis 154]MBP1896434.1 DeoR/GlpR family transcriptional regulator of sugar metabolism [Paenibacillus lactis]HAF99723.1 DeoR/GlpR transcriptional regulator [Paenibacillus lactis]
MNPLRRYEKIMEYLLTYKEVTVADLSRQLEVSGKTIREDLTKLEEQGLIVRVHGGAVLAQSDQFGILPSREPLAKHADEKSEIADKALAHIQAGDIIALDGGSTTLEIARKLGDKDLTVITNDVYIISELASKSSVRLVVPGGYRVRNMLAGPEGVAYVKQLNIQKAFISATGVHIDHGLSIYTGDLIAFKRALIDTSLEVYAVVDHHKFGQTALRTFSTLHELSGIITDQGLPEETYSRYIAAGIKLE